MNSKILLLALTVAAFSSCTTAYKSGQTPDDVYYSSAKPDGDEKTERRDNRDYSYTDEYYDDRYLRMKVANRYRWNDLNDWYSYDRYSAGYNYYYGSYYNPYTSWNYYNNPYCGSFGNTYYYNNPKGGNTIASKPVSKPRNFSLATYTNPTYNNTNTVNSSRSPVRTSTNTSTYNNSNSNSNNGSKGGLGRAVRTIFESNSNNSNNSNSSGSRTYTPSNSNSSSSSGGSGGSSGGSSGGGSVTRPGRN